MEINWSIVGLIAGLVFVYVFGLFEGRGQGYKRRKAEEEQEKKENPRQPITPAAIKADDPGLMRINNENGSLTLDLDGARVDATSLSSDQRKRLIELLTHVRPWLEGKPASAPVMQTPPRFDPPFGRQDELSTPIPAPIKPAMPTPQPTPPPPAAAPRKTSATPEDRPIAPANSIVGQIDFILQTNMAGTPLIDRGVFLAQSPEGGVMVFVGLNKYLGIDDVPDAEIKAAIRAAITEWEKKYTPGL